MRKPANKSYLSCAELKGACDGFVVILHFNMHHL